MLLSACSSQKTPNYKRTEPDNPPPEPKPVETRVLNQGKVNVDVDEHEAPPLTGRVEITTWAEDVIKGRLIQETPEAFVVEVYPPGAQEPTLRRVPRSAVMDVKPVH